MKKLIRLIAATCVLGLIVLVGCATVEVKPTAPAKYAYDGIFNPNEINSWLPLQVRPCNNGGVPHVHAIIQNPKPDVEPKVVHVVVYPPKLKGYAYVLDGKLHVFSLNVSLRKYEEIKVIENPTSDRFDRFDAI